MGKKGSWLSAIKRVFTHSSKDKVNNGAEKKSSKEKKKKGLGKKIPMFREPSSIEDILGEAEREHHIRNHRPPTPPERSKSLPHGAPIVINVPSLPSNVSPPRHVIQSTLTTNVTHPTPPAVSSSPPRKPSSSRVAEPVNEVIPARATHGVSFPPPRRPGSSSRVATPVNEVIPARAPSPRTPVATPVNEIIPARAPSPLTFRQWRVEPTLKNQHICATKIQTAFRGYLGRSYRALRGMARLQSVVKGQSVKRQTENTLKCMQMLVRIHSQIQARRIQMLENQVQQRQPLNRNEKDLESAFDKWLSENQEDWDDGTLTKEEIEARMQRKFDAMVKRERAMAYAYSRQSCKSTPRIGQGAVADFRTGGYPYWWNWLEQRQPPPTTPATNILKSPAMKSFHLTPTRSTMDVKASPLSQSSNMGQQGLGFDNMDTSTPKSTRSTVPARNRQARTPGRLPPRFSRGSPSNSPFNGGTFRDNDSLTSCPPFSIPRYMAPTVSAQAKLKEGKDRFPDSPGSITSEVSTRRNSFPLGQGTGSFKRNKGSVFSNKESSSRNDLGKNQRAQSVGNLSIDSSTSMPVSLGKKPFNRFV